MKYSFHHSAKDELKDSIDYFEDIKSGLGKRFLREVYSSIKRIQFSPNSWPKFTKNTRRCFTNKFPYSIIYFIEDNEIIIVAIMHQKRKPNYWIKRI
jgi:toxin ParE1/3/4